MYLIKNSLRYRIRYEGVIRFLLLIILLSLITFNPGCCRKEMVEARPGSPAPAFTLTDLDSNQVGLGDFEGKVVLIDFWATFCPPCKESIPYLETLYRRYKDEDFVILGISVDNNPEEVKMFRKYYHISYPILMADKKIKKLYGVTGVPEAFVLGRDGILKSHHIGFSPEMVLEIEEEIKGLL